MHVGGSTAPPCTVQIVDTLPADTYLYLRAQPAVLLIAGAWWATLTPTARYATLAALAQQAEAPLDRVPPVQAYGRGRAGGGSALAGLLGALSPTVWQALVAWAA